MNITAPQSDKYYNLKQTAAAPELKLYDLQVYLKRGESHTLVNTLWLGGWTRAKKKEIGNFTTLDLCCGIAEEII